MASALARPTGVGCARTTYTIPIEGAARGPSGQPLGDPQSVGRIYDFLPIRSVAQEVESENDGRRLATACILERPMGVPQIGLRVTEPTAEPRPDGPYAAIRPWLVRRMQSITRDPGVAEDLSQEALLRLAIEIRAGRTPDNIRAWLARVGFNLVMSRGRHHEVERRRSHELLVDLARLSPEDRAIERERTRSMCRALSELGPDDRRLLVMAASGHSGVEIARRLGRSHAAVRTRLHRLRARLRGRLAALEAA